MNESPSFFNHSYCNWFSSHIFLWEITKSAYHICICVLDYEFSILGIALINSVSLPDVATTY